MFKNPYNEYEQTAFDRIEENLDQFDYNNNKLHEAEMSGHLNQSAPQYGYEDEEYWAAALPYTLSMLEQAQSSSLSLPQSKQLLTVPEPVSSLLSTPYTNDNDSVSFGDEDDVDEVLIREEHSDQFSNAGEPEAGLPASIDVFHSYSQTPYVDDAPWIPPSHPRSGNNRILRGRIYQPAPRLSDEEKIDDNDDGDATGDEYLPSPSSSSLEDLSEQTPEQHQPSPNSSLRPSRKRRNHSRSSDGSDFDAIRDFRPTKRRKGYKTVSIPEPQIKCANQRKLGAVSRPDDWSSSDDYTYSCGIQGCSHIQYNKRIPDLKRHRITHDGKTRWVCWGKLIDDFDEETRASLPDGVLTRRTKYENGDTRMGGCHKRFSRKDALKRHLNHKSQVGRCISDADECPAMYIAQVLRGSTPES